MTPVGPDRAFSTHARLIKELGFPIVVAIILLYVIMADVPKNVAATRVEVAAVRADLSKHVAQSETYVMRLETDVQSVNDRLARIMQQICVNTAQSNTDRLGCFP